MNQPEPWSWHPSLQNCEEIISVKPRSVCCSVLTVQADWDVLLCSWTSARRHPACPTWGGRGIARGSWQVEHHGYAQKPWPWKEQWGQKGTDRVCARAAGELWHLAFYGRPAPPQPFHHLSRLLSLAPRAQQPCTLPCQGFRELPLHKLLFCSNPSTPFLSQIRTLTVHSKLNLELKTTVYPSHLHLTVQKHKRKTDLELKQGKWVDNPEGILPARYDYSICPK